MVTMFFLELMISTGMYLPGLGIRSSVFRAKHSIFAQKRTNEQFASLKKKSDSLICSFLVSDLSDSLTIAYFL